MKTLLMALTILTLSATQSVTAQGRKTRFPVGLYTSANSDIYGLSVGIGSDTYTGSDTVSVRSNGIRIEPLSQSLLFFTLIFPIDRVNYPTDEKGHAAFAKRIPNEVINGINLSFGTNAFANVNGITLSAVSQSLKNINGLSIGGMANYAFKSSGVQLSLFNSGALYSNGIMVGGYQTEVHKGRGLHVAFWFNEYKYFDGLMLGVCNGIISKPEQFRGLQIGLVNRTKKLRGIQIGLWNVNEKRSMPFINWNF